jgi:hypothetical protein
VPYRITQQGFLKKKSVAEFGESFAVAIAAQLVRQAG